ncbi:DUF4194 domain-containing protein [Halorhodospira sp. 9622]|uniref:DUF4194 domain-containing protein n=1 Tax=Halorhodospira sp. 9622 TaxID=2899136 RepID=UPI001EE84A3A|nr:DUF4194 domain-containing protein [Halorhodospira sp. 9622]MCG5539412.1 DUF4194 domain-containing protein [Halorhodospira sp. 9622]
MTEHDDPDTATRPHTAQPLEGHAPAASGSVGAWGTTPGDERLSQLLVHLLRGVLHRDSAPQRWQHLLDLQARVRDYVGVLGLELMLDEGEGYAYLRQRPRDEDDDSQLPRMVPRRQLSYPVSLLLALLRKKLAEHDAGGGDTRLILTREQIVDLMRVFLRDTANEARLLDRMDSHIRRVVELGFLRRLRGDEERYEVQRILKAFVDAQWLGEFEERLRAYRAHAEGRDPSELASDGAGDGNTSGPDHGDSPGAPAETSPEPER